MPGRAMHVNDIAAASAVVAGAVVAKEVGTAPDWVSYCIAAFTGSFFAAGFRVLNGQIKNVWSGLLSLGAGSFGGYYGAHMVVIGLGLKPELLIYLMFFIATIAAVMVRAIATSSRVDEIAQAAIDRALSTLKGGR